MFERYTENARRVIFFARYEASQYGSPTIDPQHLLLALAREAHSLLKRALGPDLDAQRIRTELEEFIPRGTRIATSVEVPLSEDAKKVLHLAVEESGRSGHGYLGPEHILLGVFLEGKSPASRILKQGGLDLAALRGVVLAAPGAPAGPSPGDTKTRPPEEMMAALEKFLARIRSDNPRELPLPLAMNAHLVDGTGLIWKRWDEINKRDGSIFGIYSGKSVTCNVVRIDEGPGETFVATVLWFNLTNDFEPSKPGHMMTVILGQESEAWLVWYAQVTPMLIT